MPNEIYENMVQPRGPAYKSDQIKPYSHYREPIDDTPGRLAGNSRIWGDASPEVQSRCIDLLLDASRDAGLTPRETAHVLAIARQESGFNPDAASNESASGLGQFIDSTGRKYGLTNNNRFDANEGARALVEHFIDNRDLAKSRGQGEEYIYKYHHDGPTRDYGGLGLSNSKIMPRLDEYEQFVRDHMTQGQEQTAQGQRTSGTQTDNGPRSFDNAMRIMLPPQNGVSPHVTGHFGEQRRARPDAPAHTHQGADFNYQGGQSGINLRHPTVHSPVSGTVESVGGRYGTVGIRDGQGNLHQILHLHSQERLRPGQPIEAGDPIGTMGGRGPNRADEFRQHVHYQVFNGNGRALDPERFWNTRTVEGSTQSGAEARVQRSSAMADGVLRERDRGPEVTSLQETLNRLGYTGRDGLPLETRSGIFGPNTDYALKQFQQAHGLRDVDGIMGSRTAGALATAATRPLLSEATHPNHPLYAEIARQLPPGTKPEVAANVTMQAMENGITAPDKLGRVDVRGNDVFVMGTTPGDRARVDLQAPTPTMQQISDHTREQSQEAARSREQSDLQVREVQGRVAFA